MQSVGICCLLLGAFGVAMSATVKPLPMVTPSQGMDISDTDDSRPNLMSMIPNEDMENTDTEDLKPDSMQNTQQQQRQDMQIMENNDDARPRSGEVLLIIDYIRPRIVEIVDMNSDEDGNSSTTEEPSSSESEESSTTTDHPVEKRNKHKIRYHIKNNYAQY